MTSFLLAALLVVGATGCSTTTVRGAGTAGNERWLARHAADEIRIFADGASNLPADIIIKASSPTDIKIRTKDATVVPIERVQQVLAVNRRGGALTGGVMGLGLGALVGSIFGVARTAIAHSASDECPQCNRDQGEGKEIATSCLAGLLIGAGLGAVIGVAVGQRDLLDLR